MLNSCTWLSLERFSFKTTTWSEYFVLSDFCISVLCRQFSVIVHRRRLSCLCGVYVVCVNCRCDRIDSAMLVEEGFQVVSTDASDRMLKYALRQRWKRRKEPAFDKWSEWTGIGYGGSVISKSGGQLRGKGLRRALDAEQFSSFDSQRMHVQISCEWQPSPDRVCQPSLCIFLW